MDKHTLEQKIRTAVEHAAPDRLEQILSACEPIQHTVNAPPAPQPAPGARKGATPMQNATKKTGLALAAAAAAVVLAVRLGGELSRLTEMLNRLNMDSLNSALSQLSQQLTNLDMDGLNQTAESLRQAADNLNQFSDTLKNFRLFG